MPKMDFSKVNYCVENKRRIQLNPFPFLTSAIQQSKNMSVQHFAGIQLSGQLEEHHLPHMFEMEKIQYNADVLPAKVNNISCPGTMKGERFQPGNTIFGQCNSFPSISFSKLVGGFVGSKSQVRSANRESCQIWDIIRELSKATFHPTTVKTNAHNCCNFGNTFPQNIFGSFCQETTSALHFASYFGLFQDTTIFQNHSDPVHKGKSVTMQMPPSKKQSISYFSKSTMNGSHSAPLPEIDSALPVEVSLPCEPYSIPRSFKQSYADVAKSEINKISKADLPNSQGGYQQSNNKNCVRQGEKMRVNRVHQQSLSRQQKHRSVDHSNWREPTDRLRPCQKKSFFTSQNDSNKRIVAQNKLIGIKQIQDEEWVKPGSERSVQKGHRYSSSSNYMGIRYDNRDKKLRPDMDHKKDFQTNERKSRNGYRVAESRMQKKVDVNKNYIIDNSTCKFNMKPEKTCMNWRCQHNRDTVSAFSDVSYKCGHVPSVSENMCDFKETGEPHVLRVSCSLPVSVARDHISSDSCSSAPDNSIGEKIQNKSNLGIKPSLIREVSSSFDSASVASLTSAISDNTICRLRYPSECESEDSFVVTFESEAGTSSLMSDVAIWSDCDTSDDSEADYVFGEEHSEGDDELDFCSTTPTDICQWDDNVSSQMSNKATLQAVNMKWQQECCSLPSDEKIPGKVQFASKGALTTIYPMIKWEYAYRSARCGPWEEMARDRTRFMARIKSVEPVLATVFNPQHRSKVWQERKLQN